MLVNSLRSLKRISILVSSARMIHTATEKMVKCGIMLCKIDINKPSIMKTTLALLFLLAISSCKTENQFVIKGTVNGDLNDEWIYLNEFMDPDPYVDSTLIENGSFTFRGNVEYPEFYVLRNNSDFVLKHFDFFLEPAKIKIELNADDWTFGSEIIGGPVNEEYNKEIKAQLRETVALITENEKKIALADSAEQIELIKKRAEFQDQLTQLNLNYISNHSDSPISPYLLSQIFFGIPFEESQNILNSFSDENKQTSIGLSLQERLDMMNEFKGESLETD